MDDVARRCLHDGLENERGDLLAALLEERFQRPDASRLAIGFSAGRAQGEGMETSSVEKSSGLKAA